MNRIAWLLPWMLLWGAACSGSASGPDGGDAGVTDGGTDDAGPNDTGPNADAGDDDAALADAEPPPDMGLPPALAPFDPEMETLPQPLSGEETAELREAFDWAATEPWPEQTPEGQPALFYALIYVASAAEYARLDRLGLHHWALPLFEAERGRWAGQLGVIAPTGDGVGSFQFAILSGGTFNAIRDYAVDGEPPFQAVIQRDPPEGFLGADGSLDHRALFQAGFNLGPQGPDAAPPPVEKLTAFAAAILAARLAEDAWNDSLGALENEFRQDKVAVGMRAVPMNTDPRFHLAGERTRMTRAWSSTGPTPFGAPLKLAGIEFVVGAGAGHLRARADRLGWARFNIGRNTRYHVCLRIDNAAAQISELWVSMQVCDFGSDRSGIFVDPPESRAYELEIQDWRLNLLAQMTDAAEFATERLGHRPSRQARVLVGALADVFGAFNDNRAFALCGGYGLTLQSLEFAGMVALVTAQFGLLPLPPDWIALIQLSFADLTFTALSFDVIMPGVPADEAATSRGIGTHEYGHFLTCDMLRRARIFDTAWAAVVNLSISIGQAAEVDILYILEATADFLTSQIAGGSNYYAPPGAAGAGAMSFCTVGAGCLEPDQGNVDPATATFRQNLAATLTLLHDIFDGGEGIERRAPWVDEGGVLRPGPGQPRPDAADEQIAIDMVDLVEFFVRLGRRSLLYDRRGFVGIWARLLRDRGYDENQICALFARHAFMGDCRFWLDGALDTDAVAPATPILVSHRVVDGTGVELTWRDISLLADVFEVTWGPEGEDPVVARVPWARETGFSVGDLIHDTRYRFAIHTVNGPLASRAIEVSEVTGAEPVGALRLVNTVPAGASLAWEETAASTYRVEYAEVIDCSADDGPCSSPCEDDVCLGRVAQRVTDVAEVTLRDLNPGARYEAVVVAVNRIGVSADPSDPLAFDAGEVTVVYVDPVGGDDGSAGDADAPVATLAAALDRAGRGADVIRLTGAHDVPDAVTLPDGVSLDGGWARARGVWAPSDVQARLTLRGATRTRASCSAPNGNDAALVGVGDVALRNLRITVGERPPVANVCRVGIFADGAELRLDNVAVSPAAGARGCVVAVESVGGRVDIARSTIVANSIRAEAFAAGLCVAAGGDVQIVDSTVVGATDVARTAVGELLGARVDAVRLTVSRSSLLAAMPLAAAITNGTVIGLDARVGDALAIDNTVIRTPPGADTNIGLDVTGRAGRLGLMRIGLSTIINGAADLAERRGAGHRGSVIRFPPDVQRAELVNNAFILGSAQQGRLAVFDRTRGENPVEFILAGNAASIRKSAAPDAVYVLCDPDDEFGRVDSVVGFDRGDQICRPANGRGVGWRVERNHALDGTATRPAIGVDARWRLSTTAGGVQHRTARMGVGRAGTSFPAATFQSDLESAPRIEGEPGVGALAPPAMCTVLDWFVDADRDGYGGPRVRQCAPVDDWSARGGDCADADPRRNPSIAERCDRIDNDCDARTDEGVANACGGCGAVPVDACDGRDNDCDGAVDELAGIDENGGRRIDLTLSTRGTTTVDNRVNSTADIDHYRVHANEALSGNFGCEGGCATANEQTRFRADLTVPGSASGAFQLCVGTGDGPDAPFQCVNIAPGQRRDLVVAMNGRNCCNGILCDQDNSAFFFATVRGQEACSNNSYRLVLTTFEQCVE